MKNINAAIKDMPLPIKELYRKQLRNAFTNIGLDYKKISAEKFSVEDSVSVNRAVELSFFKGYEDTVAIMNSDALDTKSELEKTLCNISKDKLEIKIYHDPKDIIRERFEESIYNAYFAGAHTAYKSPDLTRKKQREKYILNAVE